MARRINGAALEALRRAHGLRQVTVAHRVGVSKSHLSKIEHGVSQASDELVRKLAAELGCSTDAITHPVAVAS